MNAVLLIIIMVDNRQKWLSFSFNLCLYADYIPESCGNFDFEKGTLDGWTQGGTAFNFQPTLGDNIIARTNGSSGHQGKWWIGTYENRSSANSPAGSIQGDKPKGFLNSSLIRITGPRAEFLIGGGCGLYQRVALLVDERIVIMNENFTCGEHMTRVTSSALGAFMGRFARIQISDFSSSKGGHINFDDFKGDFDCLGKNTAYLLECIWS